MVGSTPIRAVVAPRGHVRCIDDDLPLLADFVIPTTLVNRCVGITAEHVSTLAADPGFTL